MAFVLGTLHVVICALLVLVVLMQSSKGGMASSLGGGLSSSSVLGGRTAATFLTRATAILATAFIVSCLFQALTYRPRSEVTSATERMLKQGALPAASVPVSEMPSFQETSPAAGEGAGAGKAATPAQTETPAKP